MFMVPIEGKQQASIQFSRRHNGNQMITNFWSWFHLVSLGTWG